MQHFQMSFFHLGIMNVCLSSMSFHALIAHFTFRAVLSIFTASILPNEVDIPLFKYFQISSIFKTNEWPKYSYQMLCPSETILSPSFPATSLLISLLCSSEMLAGALSSRKPHVPGPLSQAHSFSSSSCLLLPEDSPCPRVLVFSLFHMPHTTPMQQSNPLCVHFIPCSARWMWLCVDLHFHNCYWMNQLLGVP